MKILTVYLAIKQFLIEASSNTGLTFVLHHTWLAGRHNGTILNYHHISDEIDNPFILPHLKISQTHFEEQMAYLARHCHVVALRDLGEAIRNGSRLPFRTIAITFDDGTKDTLTHALPILLRYGLTATFFVVLRWIEAQRLSWLHRLNYMISLSSAGDVLADLVYELRSLNRCNRIESMFLDNEKALVILRHLLLDKLTPAECEEIVDRLWRRRVVMNPKDEQEWANRLYLSWDDIKQIKKAGMELGGHTLSHHKLTSLSEAEAEGEVIQSHMALRERLQSRIVTFAYPFGFPDSFNSRCRRILERDGVDVACALTDKSAKPGQDPLALGRLPVEDMSLSAFSMEITGLPGSLCRVRNLFKEFFANVIIRDCSEKTCN